MAGRSYNTYRGRRSRWKVVLAVILILIILAAVGFIWAQRFLVYDKDGNPHWAFSNHVESTSSSSADGSASAPPDSSAGSAASSSGAAGSSQEPEPPAPALFRAVQLSDDPNTWQAALAALSPDQNAVCVTMKASGGRLQYQSAVEGAKLSDSAAAASAALPAVLASDRHAIARVSCLRDSLYSQSHVRDASLRNTGHYIFYDGNSENWLDPSKQPTLDYLCAIVAECASLGFDEILLTDVSYPTVGKINKIDYNNAVPADALQTMVRTIRAMLSELYPNVTLSVELPSTVIAAGEDSVAGLSLTGMAACVTQLYTPTTAADFPTLSDLVTSANPNTTLIPELTNESIPDQNYLTLS